MRHSEAIALAYFVYLAAAAFVRPLSAGRRAFVWASTAAVVAIELSRPTTALHIRDWLPAVVILLAYFASGAFYVAPSRRVEAWLADWDRRLLGDVTFDRCPALLRVYLDIVYDITFVLVPAAFAVLLWTGHAAMTDRFWTIVSLAEFIPFATLPWMQARPPWAIEPPRPADATSVRRFSLYFVDHMSIRANTFPSGHASATAAVALALWPASGVAAAIFAVLSLSIAVGSVVGRFHYAIDAITGLLLAIGIWAIVAVLAP